MNPDRDGRILLALAIALHLVTAWCSSGYYAADEHYQLITFAEVKAGHEPEAHLPWEHAHRIRCTLLPAVVLAVFRAADLLGLHDPFLKALLLRLLTALAALLIVRRWAQAARTLLPDQLQRPFLWLTWCLWFLPYQHVRFTGETWSGLLVLAAATELLTNAPGRKEAVRAGLWLGLAAMVRPTTVLLGAGLLAWAWHSGRLRRNTGLTLVLCVLGAMGVVAVLDSWWYGSPVLTLWNYAMMGFGGRPGGGFEAMPWWAYGAYIVKDMLVPIGLLTLGAFVVLWVKRPAGPLLWMITPFLVFHTLVPHKEMRFLFPLADLVPLLLVQAYGALCLHLEAPPRVRQWVVLGLAAAFNLAGLAVASFTPAGSGRTRLAAQLGPEAGNVVYDADKVTVWKIAIPPFYGGHSFPQEHLGRPCTGGTEVVVTQGSTPCGQVQVERIATAEPDWACALLTAYRWRPQERGWAAYRTIR
ncbi:MAG: hypothetical protein JNL05_13385 [Flavobacteriales bacterium]|nr:hypothetical protein [Flavobacteriales bacterium]